MEIIHTLPINDLYDHAESVNCYCHPRVCPCEEGTMVVHNSFDRRELFEPDKELTVKEFLEKWLLMPLRFYRKSKLQRFRQQLEEIGDRQ